MEKLRFAPIIRVSSEKQGKRGESLHTQSTQIKRYVETLNGVIPEICWGYSGQEHATPDQERTKLNKLLADSDKNLFDAIIVCDPSRWSRDNLKSKEGLNILRQNNIRFFVGPTEYDLYNPTQNLFLGLSAEIGEFQAKIQNLKSLENKIERSKKGRPTAGRLPYGRTWDIEKGWGIDPLKLGIIKQAAERYLKGETLASIAATYKMNCSHLWLVLSKRCGKTWKCNFKNKDANIDETIIMEIPPLLDESTIKAIHQRAQANKTYTHGMIKNQYLLSRMIFCEKCGLALFGNAIKSVHRYYRHTKNNRNKTISTCHFNKLIPADEIENAVLIELVTTLGDIDRIKKAVELATPDLSKVEGLNHEMIELGTEQKKITSQKDKIIDSIADGLISKDEAKNKLEKLRERENAISNRINIIENELSSIPDMSKVKHLSKLGLGVLATVSKNPKTILNKPYAWKRKVLENAFAGRNPQGQRYGVYMKETNNPEKPWEFEIKGVLESTIINLPLSDDYIVKKFHIDNEYQDFDTEIEKIRTKFALSSQKSYQKKTDWSNAFRLTCESGIDFT